MKKSVSILTLIALLISCMFLSSCDFNAPLRNKMLDYYSNNDNYVELQGIVVSPENSYGRMEIDILTESHGFPLNAQTGYAEFEVSAIYELAPGDKITFVSAPMHFYNGHILPIMALEKDGVVLFNFEDGKESYLNWIEENFK